MSEIYWARVHPEAVIPHKRIEDAGYDMYACFEEDWIQIDPGQTVFIPLGIASAFDPQWVIFLKERGSTARYGLSLRSGVIDSGYRGEYLAAMSNIGTKPVRIAKESADRQDPDILYYPYGKAICQAVLLQMPQAQSIEISYEELCAMKSERMDGRLGSSGK